MSRDASSKLTALVEQAERSPEAAIAARALGDSLALAVEGDLALRWRLAVVRALMADPPDGDAVRECYGELVDRYRDDPPRLGHLKIIGEEIRAAEARGDLPSAMVARSDRRRK